MKKTLRIAAGLMAVCLLLGIAPVNLTGHTNLFLETAQAATPTLSAKTKSLEIGKSFTLSVKNAGGKKVTWSTSSKAIATVTTKGVVKAVKPGTATITAKVGSTKLTCKVTVKTPKISMTTAKLAKGQSFTLKVSYAGTAKVTWSTSSKAIATVTSKGVVKGLKTGTATITAKVAGKSLKCKVTVIASGSITGTTGKTMTVGKKQTLSVVGFPGKTVTWKSSNTAVATVTTKGVVTAKKVGTVTITATVASKKLTYKITVQAVHPGLFVDIVYKTVYLPYETEYVFDSTMSDDEEIVIQKGIRGTTKQEWRITYMDDVETGREMIKETVISPMTPKIIQRKDMPASLFTFKDEWLDGYVENGTACSVTGFTGSAKHGLSIPSCSTDGLTVCLISPNAFENRTELTGSLTLPDSLIWIDKYAFHGCSGFTGRLVIPYNVIAIYNYAFQGCSGFNGSLSLPYDMLQIGDYAFDGCSGFTGMLYLDVSFIGDCAFRDCDGFTDIYLTSSISSMGNRAITDSSTLEHVYADPDSYAWTWCENNGLSAKLTVW